MNRGRTTVGVMAGVAVVAAALCVLPGAKAPQGKRDVFRMVPADAFFSYQLLSVDYHGTEAVW